MACTVDLIANDIPGTFPLDLTTLVISNIVGAITVVDNFDGTVTVTPTAVGTFFFDYTISDTNGNVSNVATVTINAANLVFPVAVDDNDTADLVCGVGLSACDDAGITEVELGASNAGPIAFADSAVAPSSLIRRLPGPVGPLAVPDASVTPVD